MNVSFTYSTNLHMLSICPFESMPGFRGLGKGGEACEATTPFALRKKNLGFLLRSLRGIAKACGFALLVISLNSCTQQEILVPAPCALPMPTQTRAADIVQDLKNTLIYCQELESTLKACKGLQ